MKTLTDIFTPDELAMIQSIATDRDLSIEAVFRNALRVYQMIHTGHYKLNAPPLWAVESDKPPRLVDEGSADVARMIAAWKNGVRKWWENHDSIPAAFMELAHVIDDIERKNGMPPTKAEERCQAVTGNREGQVPTSAAVYDKPEPRPEAAPGGAEMAAEAFNAGFKAALTKVTPAMRNLEVLSVKADAWIEFAKSKSEDMPAEKGL